MVMCMMVVLEVVLVGNASSLGDDQPPSGAANAALAVIIVLNLCSPVVRYRLRHAVCVAVVTMAAYVIANPLFSNTNSLVLRVYILACALVVSVVVANKASERVSGSTPTLPWAPMACRTVAAVAAVAFVVSAAFAFLACSCCYSHVRACPQ